MITAHDFYSRVINKGFDVDGAYGNQCWDLFGYFCQLNGFDVPHCIYSGGVKDIAQLWKENKYHLKDNFDSIDFKNKKDGDWFIYGANQGGGYGHVGMFRKDNGNGTCTLLGQNQGASNGNANQINLSYSGLLIILRAKDKSKKKSEPDQVLEPGSKVKFAYEYTVDKIDVKKNKAHLVELDVWIDASHLTETKNG